MFPNKFVDILERMKAEVNLAFDELTSEDAAK